jgi:hypothetical protein
MELSPEQNAALDDLVSEVHRVYAANAVRVGLNPDVILDFLLYGPIGGALAAETPQMAAITANFSTLGDRIKRWETTLRRWAEAGVRDDGVPYEPTQWVDYALKVLLDEAQYQGKEAWNASIVVSAYRAVGETIKPWVTPELWPWWLYASAAAIGVIAVAYVANSVSPFLPQRRLAGYTRCRR